jgi:MSHA biogenesis protein MshE
MTRPKKIRLGELLIQQKLLSEEQLQQALQDQLKTGHKLGRFLVESGLINEDQIAEAISKQLNIPFIRLKNYTVNPDAIRLLPEIQARRFRALVLEKRHDSVLIGMADPTDLPAYDGISRIIKHND